MSVPSDHRARDAIEADVEQTLLVEAAAGTGKTRAMTRRIVNVVSSGRARLAHIAAITFTEAAAAELRERIRRAFEEALREASDADARARCEEALIDLDDAPISTLHAFARRLLAEHPLEAGLPPGFEVLDEIAARAAFDEAWRAFIDELLDDAGAEPTLRRALAMGMNLERLRSAADAMHRDWDRITRLPASPPGLGPVDVEGLVTEMRDLCALSDHCTSDGDRLLGHLRSVEDFAARLSQSSDDLEVLAVLTDAPKLTFNHGSKACWPEGMKDDIVARLAALSDRRDALLGSVGADVLADLLARLSQFVLRNAEARRRSGRLEFHDLLVAARDLLRDQPAVRQAVHDRYRAVYIDEFQDTDPLQIELAALIADARPERLVENWQNAEIEPGRLFVVGDPKQSIYRFRRADIRLYHDVVHRLSDAVHHLTTNFRSESSIIDWVNHVFSKLMSLRPGVQAEYVAMQADRARASEATRVRFFGSGTESNLATVRAREAEELAAAVNTVVAERWPVDDGARQARFCDIAILIPTRTTLPDLERALENAAVPYRIEARSLLFATQEARDLVNILQAIDDPGDGVAVVAALRTPAFGCRDDELLEYRQAGGGWNPLSPPPHDIAPDHHVAAAMSYLAGLHRDRVWSTPGQLADRVIRERGMLELATIHDRPRDHWRRLHYLADQARAFSDRGGATLREFLGWAADQADAGASVNEAVVPEPDDDAVRILTIHGSKGLEFPIVVLAGLNGMYQDPSPPVLFDTDGSLESRLGARGTPFETTGYSRLHAEEVEAENAERVRVLYVAATRARDHLIVSMHHKQTIDCSARRLAEACEADHLWAELPAPAPPTTDARTRDTEHDTGRAPDSSQSAPEPDMIDDRRAWLARRVSLIEEHGSAPVIAATTLASEPDPDLDEPDRPAWKRGRAGTAVGRAVHAVLQSVDLATGEGLETIAQAQAEAEEVPDRIRDVIRFARAALDAPVVREAVASRRLWREVSLGVAINGVTLEGFVDLVFEGRDGLVVVDYKTDRIEVDARLSDRYLRQGAAYAAALEEILGTEVARCVFVFVGDGRARQIEVPDLRGAVSDVRDLLREARMR